jgi:hypothetical protein
VRILGYKNYEWENKTGRLKLLGVERIGTYEKSKSNAERNDREREGGRNEVIS